MRSFGILRPIKDFEIALLGKLLESEPTEAVSKQIAAYDKSIAALKTQLTQPRTSKLTIKKTYPIKPAELQKSHYISPTENDLKKWLACDDQECNSCNKTFRKSLDGLRKATRERWTEKKWGDFPGTLTQPVLAIELRFENPPVKFSDSESF